MTTQLRFIADPGHGWLRVPIRDYPDALDYGTGYGYHDTLDAVAYLEEDCEAPAFMRAHNLTRDNVTVEMLNKDWPGRTLFARIPDRMEV